MNILTSLLILKHLICFQSDLANSYQNTGISSETWSYGRCLSNFIQLSSIYLYTESHAHHKALISWYSICSKLHFTINMKAFYFYVSDRSCQFLPKDLDIFRNVKLWSLSDKLHTDVFNPCTVNPVHHYNAFISWYSIFLCGLAFTRHCE
jgi:hypothetical protein